MAAAVHSTANMEMCAKSLNNLFRKSIALMQSQKLVDTNQHLTAKEINIFSKSLTSITKLTEA